VAQLLKSRIAEIIRGQDIESDRAKVNALAAELGVSVLDCAAALLSLYQVNYADEEVSLPSLKIATPIASTIKMVRYRLSVGLKHLITLDILKQVLVEESGVDVNNIKNVSIRHDYTLLELPDAMPPDIFQHLKTVTINQHELDIKRLKPRYKKRGYQRRRLPVANTNSGESKPDKSQDFVL